MLIITIVVVIIVAIATFIAWDNKKLKDLLKKAEQGDTQAQYDYAYKHRSKRKYDEAARWYKPAAENMHAQAQLALGQLYKEGNGVEKNPAQAVLWFQKAADQGLAEAMYELGCCYMVGEGIEKDSAKAASQFMKAAEQEYGYAQYEIGCCYMIGNGVTQNDVEAKMWFQKANKNNVSITESIVGFNSLNEIFENCAGYDVVKNIQYTLFKNGYSLKLDCVHGKEKENERWGSIKVCSQNDEHLGNIVYNNPFMYFPYSRKNLNNKNKTRLRFMCTMNANIMVYLTSEVATISPEMPEWLRIATEIMHPIHCGYKFKNPKNYENYSAHQRTWLNVNCQDWIH